jgi:hypothetical protein
VVGSNDAPGIVVLCGTDAAALGSLAEQLPGRVVVFVGDPSDERDRAAIVEAVNELFARD